jgi:glycosyltransferase involved in cell wall biosynthesis
MARVSVLMPVYKPKVEYFTEALDCLFSQTEQDWECIIHNQPWDPTSSASGDYAVASLKKQLAEYLKDPRVQFIQSDTLRTIGENWNACLPHATSPYLAYLFYDDLWEPDYLKTLCDILDNNPSVGFVSANRSYLFMGDSPKEAIYDEATEFMKNMKPGLHEGIPELVDWMQRGLKPNAIGEPSFVVMRKSMVEKAGHFHPTMAQFLDAEYWTRCLAVSDWYFEPRTLGKFRVHAVGTSALNAAAGKGLYDRLETMEAAVALLPPQCRRDARTALRHTLAGMIRKYLDRWKKARTGVQTQGGGGSAAVKKFAMKHPLIMAGAMVEAILGKAKT